MDNTIDNRISTLLKSVKVLREDQEIPLDAMSYLTGIGIDRLRGIEESTVTPTLAELQRILSALNCHIDILRDRDDKRPACLAERFPKRKTVVLVIGNGFDIGMGLRTGYGAFIKSPFWPFHGADVHNPDTGEPCFSPFADYLREAVEKRSDLEGIMRDFCAERLNEQERTGNAYAHADADLAAFKALCRALCSYLRKEQDDFLADEKRLSKARRSTAGQTLLRLMHSGDDVFVHSFNYTDIELIAYHLDVEDREKVSFEDWARKSCWYHQMHSTLYKGYIVLGVEEDCPMPECLSFLRKPNHPSFIPSDILRNLEEADSVVFFGHSMAKIDQCYFGGFFADQSRRGLPIDKSKDITFYTLNEHSWNDIQTNLQSMDGVNLVNLKGNNHVEVFFTA